MALYNLLDKEQLMQKLIAEPFKRITLSFYRYRSISDPEVYRNTLYINMESLGVLGRTYIAAEGVNAQISVPEPAWEAFTAWLAADEILSEVPLKIAVEDDGRSFYKLIVRVKKKIVADGLDDQTFDPSDVGEHLDAEAFHQAMEDPRAVVIDMRNHYESEVGHFTGALLPEADTFRDCLEMGKEMLKGKENPKVLLYCTGGIRCEKASAWFKHQGYTDVGQLHGGIIDYARQIKQKGMRSRFIGKNFVFDNRMGERITNEVISTCHQCGQASDRHVNCANDECHLLFIQCEKCAEEFEGCCTPACRDIIQLPVDEQRRLRKGKKKEDSLMIYRSRLRPDLKRILAEQKSNI